MTYRVMSVFEHTQDTPESVWTINHSVGGYPVVDVFVQVDGVYNKIIPAAVTYVNPNVCTVTFTVPTAGYATVI